MEGSLGDIEDSVRQWATKFFDKNRVGTQRKLNCDALMYNIDWGRVNILHDDPEFSNSDMAVKPNAIVLFTTYFSNTTDSEQSYSFQTTRMSKKVAEFSLSSTFTRGGSASLKLKLPLDIVELGASFNQALNVTNNRSQSFEEEISWTVNTNLQVPSGCRRSVRLNITEVKYTSDFNLRSTVCGRVRVSITNPDDNNSLVKHLEADISAVLKESLITKSDVVFDDEAKEVVFVSRGCASFRFGTEQHVEVEDA